MIGTVCFPALSGALGGSQRWASKVTSVLPKSFPRRTWLIVLLCAMPVVTLANPIAGGEIMLYGAIAVVVLEVVVALIEAMAYAWLLPLWIPLALGVSICANLASLTMAPFLAGLLRLTEGSSFRIALVLIGSILEASVVAALTHWKRKHLEPGTIIASWKKTALFVFTLNVVTISSALILVVEFIKFVETI